MSLTKNGIVTIMGAGCGDYDLITLRGKKVLEQCEVVVYDSLIDSRLLELVPITAEKICVGKRCGRHSETQENINALLVSKAREGKIVVRVKGGDPFVFGRGGEEIAELQRNNIRYDIVPGISSSIAVPELAGIPVTHRKVSRSFHVITGHTADDFSQERMRSYAKLDGTLVFLMGLSNLGRIAEELIRSGMDGNTSAAVISDGASTKQKVVRAELNRIADEVQRQQVRMPAVIVIGETAGYDFSPNVSRPLSGVTVTVTGTRRFSHKLSDALEKMGAEIQRLEHLDVVEYKSNAALDRALKNLSEYSIIVLTSINGAEIFFKKLFGLKTDIRTLSHIRFAVIGSGTAEVLERHGIFPDLIPDKFTSERLAEQLCGYVKENERVLILRAEKGSRILNELLDKNNITYDDIKTYDVQSKGTDMAQTDIIGDYITFASSSGVKAFFDSGLNIPDHVRIICIGDITAETLRRYHVNDFRISETRNIDGIIRTIIMEEENEKIQKAQIK